MIRLLLLLLFVLAAIGAKPAWAQLQPLPAAAPALTPEQARAALDVLNDPEKRAQITATLEAIAAAQSPPEAAKTAPPAAPAARPAAPVAPPAAPAAQPAAPAAQPVAPASQPAVPTAQPAAPAAQPAVPAPQPAPQAAPIQLVPNSLGAQFLLGVSRFLSDATARLSEAVRTMYSLPLLWDWLVVMCTAPWARAILLDVAWRLAVALLCAGAVYAALRWAVRRPMAALENSLPPNAAPTSAVSEDTAAAEQPEAAADAEAHAEAGATEPPAQPRYRISASALLRRMLVALARLALDLIPVLGFLLVGHLVAAGFVAGTSTLVTVAVVDATACYAAVLCVARMLLSPTDPRLRLLRLSDATADYLMRWTCRLAAVAVFGYAIPEVGLLLGMSQVAYGALLKADGLVLSVLMTAMVVQKRQAVREWLHASPGATGFVARLRNAIAAVWQWIALFFIAGNWLVWALGVSNGFTRLAHFLVLAALLLIGARLLLIVLDGALERLLQAEPEALARDPGLEGRLRMYRNCLNLLLRGVVDLLVLLGFLQLCGVPSFAWFAESNLGQRTVSALGTGLVTLALALAVWEAANLAMQRHLNALAKDQQVAREARLRTLQPLLRMTLMIAILTVTGLTLLSEIGINIAPLLAGAGIVGVAIGFGSQTLVRDVITGVFLLLENAVQVGDWVTVSGLSGKVEALSVRTIRLRADDGSVQIIPFSAVTTVTNVNRGLGNAAVRVSVAYQEDTDRVATVLGEIVAGMRAEPDFAGKMLSDLQLWGVDKVDGAEATILGQVVCTDSGRWSVQREFNRRMKMRFQELGIQLFDPMRRIVVTLPPPGHAAEDLVHERSRAAE